MIEALDITNGEDITHPFHLTSSALKRKPVRGAITIKNEEEVFINRPVSKKNVEKELLRKLKELEKLREQVKKLENLKHEKAKLEEKSRNLEETIKEKDEEIGE